ASRLPVLTRPPAIFVLVLFLTSMVLLVSGLENGVATLIARDRYISVSGNRLSGVGLFGVMLVVALSGARVTQSGSGRWICIAILAIAVLVSFSLASRRLALTPLLFALGFIAAGPSQRRGRLVLLSAMALTGLLLLVALSTRGLEEHG